MNEKEKTVISPPEPETQTPLTEEKGLPPVDETPEMPPVNPPKEEE